MGKGQNVGRGIVERDWSRQELQGQENQENLEEQGSQLEKTWQRAQKSQIEGISEVGTGEAICQYASLSYINPCLFW